MDQIQFTVYIQLHLLHTDNIQATMSLYTVYILTTYESHVDYIWTTYRLHMQYICNMTYVQTTYQSHASYICFKYTSLQITYWLHVQHKEYICLQFLYSLVHVQFAYIHIHAILFSHLEPCATMISQFEYDIIVYYRYDIDYDIIVQNYDIKVHNVPMIP
jgi:hypothetical protein